MKILLLCGIKHSGKSKLGKLIAIYLGYDFFDLDQIILENQPEESVRDIWLKRGKKLFEELEAKAAFKLNKIIQENPRKAVLSLGGGIIENSKAMLNLEGLGVNIYLKGSEKLLFKRIMAKGRPPFLSESQPEKDFSVLYERRDRLYEQFADIVHVIEDLPPEQNVSNLLVTLEKNHVWK